MMTSKLDEVMWFRAEPGPPRTVGLSALTHNRVRGLEGAKCISQNSPGAFGHYWPSKRMAEPLGAILFLSKVLLGAVSLSTE